MNNGNESFDKSQEKEAKKQQKELAKQQKKIDRQNELHPLRYKKAGVRLTRAEVAKIKAARKELRADIKAAGIKDRKDKKILEVAKGAYFDQPKAAKPILAFLSGRTFTVILVALITALAILFAMSEITKMKGHFSVNITDDLFDKGFSIGETLDEDGNIKNPTSYLRGDVVEDTPCISITWIDEKVDQIDGSHNGKGYFAYTFYIQNAGKEPCSYAYSININSQSNSVRNATWVMVFEDGEMSFYAAQTSDGDNQTLPKRDDNTRGYREPPFIDVAKYPDQQFQIIENDSSSLDYYRLIALPFQSDSVVTSGKVENTKPGEVHKYTVVLWLEGDDPECTDELIGGHLGLEFNFEALD